MHGFQVTGWNGADSARLNAPKRNGRCRYLNDETQSTGLRFPDAIYTFTMHDARTTAGRAANLEPQRRTQLSFTTEQWVPFPLSRVFAFFADPLNLPRLMPAWQDARIDRMELQPSGGRSQAADRGSRILLSFRPVPLSPIRLRWLALIDDYAVDHHFCDMQVTGPFGYWRHCHLVNAEKHGDTDGTRVTDVVDYEWPVRSLSAAIDVLGGRLRIRQVFRHRQRQLLRLLGRDVVRP
jgi:ligand-binding SRPBCC domain-containing protein